MTTTVESMQPRGAELWPLSVKGYRALAGLGLIPKNTELLYGQVYRKMSKSPLHSALVRRFLRRLHDMQLSGCFISSEQPLTCPDSEPEPDIAVVRGREEDFWTEHPREAELVVEICVSSHDYDRFKLRAYAEAGVKEVWLVLAPEKQIQVYRHPMGGGFVEERMTGPGGLLTCQSLPDFTLDLDGLFSDPQ